MPAPGPEAVAAESLALLVAPMGNECAAVRRELGVHLLRALDPADRGEVEAHLGSCARCRGELAGLAGLPALLRRVPVAEAALLGSADEVGAGGPVPW